MAGDFDKVKLSKARTHFFSIRYVFVVYHVGNHRGEIDMGNLFNRLRSAHYWELIQISNEFVKRDWFPADPDQKTPFCTDQSRPANIIPSQQIKYCMYL